MWRELLRAIPVYFSSMLKFIFGPLGGYAAGLKLITTILVTVAGMMTVVLLITYAGDWLRQRIIDRYFGSKRFSDPNGKYFRFWKRYGLAGVAAITPLLLTPIGGAILALSSGSPKERIIFFMFVSAAVWSVLLSVMVYFFGNEILLEYIK